MKTVLLQASAYENFDLTQPLFTMDMIIWGAVIGCGIGAIWSVISRRSLGMLIKKLKAAGADTPEKAVTLSELGLSKNPLLKQALKAGKPLRRYVQCANEDEFAVQRPSEEKAAKAVRKIFSLEAEEKVLTDYTRARYYLPDEARYTAEVRYDMKGTDPAGLVISLILLIGLGFGLRFLIPELLTLLDNFLTGMKQ